LKKTCYQNTFYSKKCANHGPCYINIYKPHLKTWFKFTYPPLERYHVQKKGQPPKQWVDPVADPALCGPTNVVVVVCKQHDCLGHGATYGFSGLTKLVGMFVSRVTHQLFQVIDPVLQCRMLLQRALGDLAGYKWQIRSTVSLRFAMAELGNDKDLRRKLWWFPSFWWACSTWLLTCKSWWIETNAGRSPSGGCAYDWAYDLFQLSRMCLLSLVSIDLAHMIWYHLISDIYLVDRLRSFSSNMFERSTKMTETPGQRTTKLLL